MGRGDVSLEKMLEIRNLKDGDIIEVRNGAGVENHEVRRVLRVNIETMFNGTPYRVPFTLFNKIVKKADRQQILSEKREEFRTLKPNEPFWYNDGKKAVILYFKELKPGKIIGVSPLNNVQWTIPESFYGGKIEFPVAVAK